MARTVQPSDKVTTLATNTEITIQAGSLDYERSYVIIRCYDDAAALDADQAQPTGLTANVYGIYEFEDGATAVRTLANGDITSDDINSETRTDPAGSGPVTSYKIVLNGDWTGYYIRAHVLEY